MNEPTPSDSSWREAMRQLATYAHVGTMFPVSIAIGLAGGHALDRWWGTSPWLAVAGFGLGVAAAVLNLMRTVTGEERRQERERHERIAQRRERRRGGRPDGSGSEP